MHDKTTAIKINSELKEEACCGDNEGFEHLSSIKSNGVYNVFVRDKNNNHSSLFTEKRPLTSISQR